MKRVLYSLAAVAALISVSCSQIENTEIREEPVGKSSIDLTITASLGDEIETKTALQSDKSIWWTKDDAVNLFYGTTGSGVFTTDITEPAATATFSGTLSFEEGSSEATTPGLTYWGVYPYNEENALDGTGVILTIPGEQAGVPGTFADKLNPAVATGTSTELSFLNVGSWFIFTVAQEGITSATFKGNKDEDIAGKVKVTMNSSGKPVAEVKDGLKSITITPAEGDAFVAGQEYRIVLLPQALQDGYTLTLRKGDDLSANCVVSGSKEFPRSASRRKKNADDGLSFVAEMVDLGNGVLWATRNLGATSPEGAGNYYAWGETETKSSYSWNTYKWGTETALTKYVLDAVHGEVDNKNILEPSDDAATASLGGDWRIPSKDDWEWLYGHCTKTLEELNGVRGIRFTSEVEGYTENSIFLPFVGIMNGSSVVALYDEGVENCFAYWGSTLYESASSLAAASEWTTKSTLLCDVNFEERYYGLPVRPVCSAPVPVTGIDISASKIEMALGDSPIPLGSTVYPENATDKTVIWTSSDESVVSLSSSGSSVAIGASGVGTATVTATTADGGFTASCVVTVAGVPTTGVTLEPTSLVLGPGDRYQLNATVLPEDASIKTVKWSSSNEDDVYVSETGEVLAKALNGSSTITVTTDYGGFTATCEVTVKYVEVTGVTLEPTSLTLAIGESATLTATVQPEDATNPVVFWSSSDETVAMVSNGTVTANSNCRGGSAIITVSTRSEPSEGYTATCEVTVTVPVEEVVLSNEELHLYIGDNFQLGASVRPTYATNQNITWSSSDESVVSVDSNGLLVTKKVGSATITVTTEDGGHTDTCEVTVQPAEINGHAYVKMGIKSVDGKVLKWATMNVGATSETDYGDYFAWGEVKPKDDYSWSTYFDTDDNGSTFVKYSKDKIRTLESGDDAARQNWGGTWRMPTNDEWGALRSSVNTEWQWDGSGYKVTSKIEGYEGNYIYLPASRHYEGTNLGSQGYGHYWSSSLNTSSSSDSSTAYWMGFNFNYTYNSTASRCYGLTIRPVSE